MFPKFENDSAGTPDTRQQTVPPAQEINPRLRLRASQLQRALMAAPSLRGIDAALRQSGRGVHISAQADTAIGEIEALERLMAFDPDLARSPEEKAILGQARVYDPVMADIEALETGPGPGVPESHPAAAMTHESGILNLTAEHSLPVPPHLVAGEKIIEGLGHALGHANGNLADQPTLATKKLREAIGDPVPVAEEDLEAVLAPHEACADGVRPD